MPQPILIEIEFDNRTAKPQSAAVSASRWISFAEAVTVLAVTAAYFFPFSRLLHRVGDEGTIVYGAQRVLEGAVPYRDFVEVMGPGSFYWLALFFRLFGDTWQISRLCLLVTAVVTALLVYSIARQYVGRPAAVVAWLFFVILSVPLWPAPNHHLYSNLFALAAVAAFLSWRKAPHAAYLATAGFLAGITSCFIQQKGFYLLAAFVVLTLIDRKKFSGWFAALRPPAVLLAGYAAVGASVLFLFCRAGALRDLIYCTFQWPLSAYHAVNAGIYWQSITVAIEPAALYFRLFPIQLALLLQAACLIPFILLLILPLAAIIFGLKSAWQNLGSSHLILTLPGFAIWLSEMHRKEIYHLAFGCPLLIIAGLQLLDQAPRVRVKYAGIWVTAVALALVAIGDLWNTRGGYPIETRRGKVLDVNRDDALVFLNSAVPRGEWVFVYPYYPMYYYLAAIRNPTRYSILMYDYNTVKQFDEVIRDLKNKRVKFVLWDTVVDGANLRTWFPGYVPPPADQLKLEQYLQASYQVISIKNGFRILERKE